MMQNFPYFPLLQIQTPSNMYKYTHKYNAFSIFRKETVHFVYLPIFSRK